MLGDFLTRILVLLLGYAYPAFECYKTVEKIKVNIDELRFWCQYWVVVSLLTVFERVGDIFISWLPMYGEAKLAFIIFLWYPKTKGTGYIYETMLRPLLGKHEPEIERKILELKARIWDFAMYYWENCTDLGQTKFFHILQYMASQSTKFSNSGDQKNNDRSHPAPPPSPTFRQAARWGPSTPRSPGPTVNRSTSESPRSDTIKINTHKDRTSWGSNPRRI
jgi:receptor expression-enhancing protein 1/2/3/4